MSSRILPAGVFVAGLFAAGLLTACSTFSSHSIRVLLPEGDAARGQMAFQQLQCQACHQVSGHNFAGPYAQPPTLVVLGTEDVAPSRAQLVDSILNPSHRRYRGPAPDLESSGSLSRMGDFSEVMTVRQLADVVAFLESLHKK